MEQLSSCYFCGAALDASLDEYPVVPKDLHPTPDDQKTVVLCQGCRQKLGTVVETIVDVFDQETLDERGTTAREVAAGDAPESTGEDPLADEGWVGAGELSADAGSSGGNTGAEPSGGNAGAEPSSGNAGTDTGRPDAQSGGDGSGDVTYTTSTAAGGRKSVSGNAESIRDEGEAARGNDGGTTGENGGGAASASDAGTTPADAGRNGSDPADDDGPSLTALENTKVMRLLQNREFPVDRAEIRTVAVNAYDMDESRFDTVVDAAVEKGLIGEENGQIVETK